jgi:hypothetical protein
MLLSFQDQRMGRSREGSEKKTQGTDGRIEERAKDGKT